MLFDAPTPAKPPRPNRSRALRQFLQRVVHIFNLTFGTLILFAIALIAAFIAMRLAIHGREVNVPSFAGLSDTDAESLAKSLGLNLQVENRFYSVAVAPNHVLSQSPAQGNRVRRGWQVRVTESLGGQQVAIPDVTGQNERTAAVALRRLALDVGNTAHLPAAIPAGLVLAQSPPPDSSSSDGPGVSLLVTADPLPPSTYAYVMPSLIGLSLPAATARLATAGLHIASAQDPVAEAQAAAAATSDATQTTPASPTEPKLPVTIPPGDLSATILNPTPPSAHVVITSQSPQPGHRVTRADNIRVTLSH